MILRGRSRFDKSSDVGYDGETLVGIKKRLQLRHTWMQTEITALRIGGR